MNFSNKKSKLEMFDYFYYLCYNFCLFFRQYINMNMTSPSSYMVTLEVNYRELFATSYRRSMKYSTQNLLGNKTSII